MKSAKNSNKSSAKVKKPLIKRWWFWVLILGMMVNVASKNNKNKKDDVPDAQDAEWVELANEEQAADEPDKSEEILLAQVKVACRMLTKDFVEGVVGEKCHLFTAYSDIRSYELDDDGNGMIEFLYMPDVEEGETKVNLTIEKSDNVYTITYALLAGLWEVDMGVVPEEYKVFVDVV